MRTTRTITASLAAVLGAAALAGPAAADSQKQPDSSYASKSTTEGSTHSTHLKMPANSAAPRLAKSRTSLFGLFAPAVKFRNSHDTTVWVAFMRYDPDRCRGYGDWQTKGWLRLKPGEVKQAFTTSNRYAYYYAKAADGTKWSGTNQSVKSRPVYVYHSAFDSCLTIGSTDAYGTVSMRRIEVRRSLTVNLT
jgi:uncharacterized membrane protein